MTQRIKIDGLMGTLGACRGCTKILVVTDLDADNTYCTYHDDPLCEWYKKNCVEAKDLGNQLHDVEPI